MLETAEHRAKRLNRHVSLRIADAEALPFASQRFDTVVCTFALCCITNEREALAEATRVLRPGGDLLLADHVAATFWPLRVLQHAADVVSVPLQGEHYTRRPITSLPVLGMHVVATERLTLGAIERVHARKPVCT